MPARHKEEGVWLGDWLVRQRMAHTNGNMDAARRTRLEGLGVVWGTSAEQRWEHCFALLKAFREREGGLRCACEARGGGREDRGLVE